MTTKALKWTRHEDLAINRRPCVGREEYLDHMTFQANLRPLFTEPFGPLIGLKEEWEAQGATPAELNFSAFRYRCEERGWVPVKTGRNGGLPEVLLDETESLRIWRDGLGRTMRLSKGTSTLPIPMDHPVRTMDDWIAIKPWYEFAESRFTPGWEAVAQGLRAEDKVVVVSVPGGFDEPRQLLGEEGLCLACYEDPELIHDIVDTIAETAHRVLDRVTAAVPVDLLSIHEDMAGKSGPLFGPAQVREFMVPYYRRIWDLAQDRGARVFDQDSDGDMRLLIDLFLEAGVNCMHPMEPGAGMDIVSIRQQYGNRLAFYGGLDKHVLRQSKEAIDRELARKLPLMLETGGCVLGLDHRIPNGTPLANYRYYIQRVWEAIENH